MYIISNWPQHIFGPGVQAAQIGRAVAYSVSVRCHLCLVTRIAGPHPSTSRETAHAKPMEPRLAEEGR